MPDVETLEPEVEVKPLPEEEDGIIGPRDRDAEPDEVEEPQEEVKPEDEKPTEEEPKELEVKDEPKEEQPKPDPAAVPKAITPAPPSEREPVDHFEAIGLKKDDTLGRKLVEAHLAGDLQNFLKVWGTDWKTVPAIDVVRADIEKKYAKLPAKDRDFMVAREMKQYDTSSFDEDEKRAAELELELKADGIRERYEADKAQYKVPDRSKPSDEELQAQQQAEKDAAEFEQSILNDPALADFETKKAITIGEGETAFNYKADKVDVRALLAAPPLAEYLTEKGGKTVFNTAKYIEDKVLVTNKADVLKRLAEHYMMLGERRYEARLRNPGDRKVASASPNDVGEDAIIGPSKRRY